MVVGGHVAPVVLPPTGFGCYFFSTFLLAVALGRLLYFDTFSDLVPVADYYACSIAPFSLAPFRCAAFCSQDLMLFSSLCGVLGLFDVFLL